MKLYKYSLIAALALSGALSACSDDVEYNAAEPTPGVFFPVNANITKLTIEPEAGSFDIEVARYGFSEEQTYSFTNNFSEFTGFSMPGTVTFAAGQTTAVVSVSYDGTVMTPGVFDLNIGFAENQPVNKFGETALKIAVTLPEPVEVLPWNDLGECTFTEPFISQGLYGIPSLTYKVHIEESGDTPGLYRLVAPYGSAFAEAWTAVVDEEGLADDEYDSANEGYLVIHAEDPDFVYIEVQNTGVSLGDGPIYGMNEAGWYLFNENPLELVKEKAPKSFASMKDGVLTLPAKNSWVALPALGDEDMGPYYGNSKGSVKMVVMPGVVASDLVADVTYVGQFNNAQTGQITAVASIEFGKDVTAATAALVRGGSSAAAKAAELLMAGQLAGAINVDLSNPTVSFPLEAGGEWSIVVATTDGAGAQDAGSASFEALFYADDAAWEPLGYGQMADGWILALFGYDQFDYGYEVAVSESKANPGIYRLKAPWGPGTPLSDANQATTTTDVFIDTRDEELIVIMPQNSGFEFAPQLNYINVCNREGYMLNNGYTRDELVALKGKVDTKGIPYITTSMEEDAQVGYIITVENSWIIGNGTVFGGTGAGYVDTSVIIIPFKADQGGEGEGGEGEEGGETSVAPKQVRANAASFNRTFKSRFHIASPTNVKRLAKNAKAVKANL